MVKPDKPAEPKPNINSQECTTCTHARNFHRHKLYYCEADIMVDDPEKPGKAKIKAPCPCTKFTDNEILTIDKTDHGFSKHDSKDKDKYTREGIDIKDETPKPDESVHPRPMTPNEPSNPKDNEQKGKPLEPVISDSPIAQEEQNASGLNP